MNNVLEYKGYMGTVDFSPEDKVFFGTLFGIHDVVTFEGESVSELESAFKDVVNDYISTCEQVGKEPEKVYTGTFNVRVPSDLHKRAAFIAMKKRISLNNFIKFALGYVVSHEQEIEPELKSYSDEKVPT